MKTSRVVVLLIGAFTVAGCFTSSLHSLSDDSVAITDAALVGKWVPFDRAFKTYSKDTHWKIETAPGKKYTLTVTSHGKKRRYDLHLVQLGDCRYFDISLVSDGDVVGEMDVVRIHRFHRVHIEHDTVRISTSVSEREFAEVAAKHGLPFTKIDGRVVLTASTRELQQFFREHGSEVFGKTTSILKRRD